MIALLPLHAVDSIIEIKFPIKNSIQTGSFPRKPPKQTKNKFLHSIFVNSIKATPDVQVSELFNYRWEAATLFSRRICVRRRRQCPNRIIYTVLSAQSPLSLSLRDPLASCRGCAAPHSMSNQQFRTERQLYASYDVAFRELVMLKSVFQLKNNRHEVFWASRRRGL